MQDIKFTPLFWFFGVIGGIAALAGVGVIVIVARVLQDHWH